MTAIQDTVPSLRQKKTWVVLVVSILGFLGGLAVTCEVRLSDILSWINPYNNNTTLNLNTLLAVCFLLPILLSRP